MKGGVSMSMITEVCAEVNNWFAKKEDKIGGAFSVVDGVLTPPVGLLNNQYYRIIDSRFNDGVHKYAELTELTEESEEQQPEVEQLIDEPSFDGAVWKMRVPADFLQLVADIEEWQEKNGNVDSFNMSPYQSESFNNYSRSKGGGGSSASGASPTAVGWQSQFKSRLNKYRKLGVQ